MSRPTLEQVVAGQFGPRAEAYVQSAVHAQGEDLTWLRNLVEDRAAKQVLDMGCGGGHVSYRVAEVAESVVALDLSPAMLAVVEREAGLRGLPNLSTVQGDVGALPFADGSFDAVLSRYSAHHWPLLGTALQEARRVLRPGGLAAFVDVASPEDDVGDTFLQAMELLRDGSHVRDHRTSAWTKQLELAGFVVVDVRHAPLRLAFDSWVARMATPALRASAIRDLQTNAPAEVIGTFEIEEDGSFTVDVVSIEARAS